MSRNYLHLSTFTIEGDYLGITKKHLHLISNGERIFVKLPKQIRESFDCTTNFMTRIHLSGAIHFHVRRGRMKMHIDCAIPLTTEPTTEINFSQTANSPTVCQNRSVPLNLRSNHLSQQGCQSQTQDLLNGKIVDAKIMICQKSGCRKRGGKKLLSQLQQTLQKEGLHDQVKIQTTGCQKQCDNAPSCILKVGKKKYRQVNPDKLKQKLHQERFFPA